MCYKFHNQLFSGLNCFPSLRLVVKQNYRAHFALHLIHSWEFRGRDGFICLPRAEILNYLYLSIYQEFKFQKLETYLLTVLQGTLIFSSNQRNFIGMCSNIFILNNLCIVTQEKFAKCSICKFYIFSCTIVLL